MDYTPEAWDADMESFRKAVLIGLLLDVAIAKLEVEMDEDYEYEGEDCPLDGDAESALASAGFGTDEDYGGYTHDWEDGM